MNGFTHWLFGASDGVGDDLMRADFAGGWYFIFALAVTAIGVGLLLRFYGRRSL